jgi:hypothetical protein
MYATRSIAVVSCKIAIENGEIVIASRGIAIESRSI